MHTITDTITELKAVTDTQINTITDTMMDTMMDTIKKIMPVLARFVLVIMYAIAVVVNLIPWTGCFLARENAPIKINKQN